MNVLLHYSPGPAWQRDLASLASQGLSVDWCDERDDDRFYALLSKIEVLWHLLRPLSAADIARAPKLRLIQKIGIGVNTIDLDAARSSNIAVCNMPGTNSRAVAEMTILLMLSCLRRLPLLDRATREGRWNLGPNVQDTFGELAGKTVGLVGYGAVAQIVAPILTAMDAHVIYTDLQPNPGATEAFRELPALLREADIVSLHVPLTPATANMIGPEQLAMMRTGAILINTARGGLVEQDALVESLRQGHLGAAGLDVFASEPVSASEPILKLDNVVVAPHVSWLTAGTWDRSLKIAVENCRRLLAGAPLLHRVA
jgi:phosphoglycerate dehydrogenase-like enzyme